MQERLLHMFYRYGDAALAALITTVAVVQIAGFDEPTWTRLAAVGGAVALGVAAAVRARAPLLSLTLLLGFLALGSALPGGDSDIGAIGLFVLLAIYSAAAHCEGRRAAIAGGVTVVLTVAIMATDPEGLNIAGSHSSR